MQASIKKNLFLLFAFCGFVFQLNPLFGSSNYSIVFVHIGNNLPSYVETALIQARMFNEECPIILISNEQAFNAFHSNADITCISCESLIKTQEHQRFATHTTLDTNFRDGFWRYTSERFLYLQDLMEKYGLKNVFHLEYDNMLYADLEEFLPIFMEKYKGIAATFDNDQRCIPGFVYIKDAKVMKTLAKCFADNASSRLNDMEILGIYKNQNGTNFIDHLPIIHGEYVQERTLVSNMGHTVADPKKYSQNIELFGSIFDGAAIGQYLGGIDPRNGHSCPGFINESCVFNVSLLSYEWISDEFNRKIPYAVYGGKKVRINNLHVHSKNLHSFLSKDI